jgi:methionyl-tRNA formyltransferase
MSKEVLKSLRIAFMGTPDFSTLALQALIDSNHEVVCVYSQPPRPKGRGQKLQKSSVHQCAENAGIEVRTPVNFKNESDVKFFQNLNLDVAVVAAYGLILPQALLDTPRYGCINIHASILPRWRGAAPIHRAIWAGDDRTGVTLMQMDAGLDTGDMLATSIVPITLTTTLSTLHDMLSGMGAKMIVPCMDELSMNGELLKTPQSEEGMTYAKMLRKDDGRINWAQSSQEIDRQVRALNPWPGTWGINQEGKRIKILETQEFNQKSDESVGTILENGFITCGNNSVLQLLKIQPENKKSMDIKTALNGEHIKVGNVLS